jgi:putative transposase
MSIRKINFTIGEFYHVYNRGNSKQNIFLDTKDKDRFMGLLLAMNRQEKFNFADSIKGISVYDLPNDNPLVAIGAHSVMTNHFHILLTPIIENGVSIFMQKISTAYVMYFNQKYSRTGSLFEGKFKAKHIDSDRYLKYIFSYLHLNPNDLVENLMNYPYSSFLDYYGVIRPQNKIINRSYFPDYFPTKEEFLSEIKKWLNYRKEEKGGPTSWKI